MSDKLVNSMAAIRDKAKLFNNETNQLNNYIKNLEHSLGECKLGIDVTVGIPSASKNLLNYFLIYSDSNRTSRIIVRVDNKPSLVNALSVANSSGPKYPIEKSWIEWNRDVKIHTAQYLDILLNEISDVLDDRIARVEAAGDVVSSYIESDPIGGSKDE
jgi:hypothetical protein